MKINLEQLVRKNIWNLKPYSSARDDFKGEASAFLDANENPLTQPYNRYPDPLQNSLKKKVSVLKNIDVDNIFFGNGSDEPIDIVIRIFCEPQEDNIVAIDPSYGMYQVCADINGVEYRKVLLNDDFSLSADRLLSKVDSNTKLIFLCSPNNPTANSLEKHEILKIFNNFSGIVVIDEAYIDFSEQESWLSQLNKHSNMIVLQTLSKAWGLAAVRFGMAFAASQIISLFNKVKYPYNINVLTQNLVLEEIEKEQIKNDWVKTLITERAKLTDKLKEIPLVDKVYPSDANFILVKVKDANKIYRDLVNCGVIVRNRNTVSLCQNCLRITVGTASENEYLIKNLQNLK